MCEVVLWLLRDPRSSKVIATRVGAITPPRVTVAAADRSRRDRCKAQQALHFRIPRSIHNNTVFFETARGIGPADVGPCAAVGFDQIGSRKFLMQKMHRYAGSVA